MISTELLFMPRMIGKLSPVKSVLLAQFGGTGGKFKLAEVDLVRAMFSTWFETNYYILTQAF